MQFIGKLMYQTGKNDIKPSFGPDFGPFGTNLGHKNFFHGFSLYYMLDIVASYHCMQFQGKLMNQTRENNKKPSFWPDFGPFGQNLASPLLDVRHCCKLSLYIISRKTNESNLRKWQNTQLWVWFCPIWPEFGLPIFFFKNLTSSGTRCHGYLSPYTISEKNNDPILKKLNGRRTD